MSAAVPTRRSIAQIDDVVTGRAVRGRTHRTAAELLNWTSGNGETLIPAYDPDQTIAAGATKTFRYRVQPNGRAVRRVWSLALFGTGNVTITAGASAPVLREVSLTGLYVQHNEDLTAKSASDQEISLTIASGASSASSISVVQIACMESPRAVLDKDAADYGIELTSEAAREPIDARDYNSLGGIAAALALAPQRRHYLAYARPANTTDCWSDLTGAFVPLLTLGPLLGRKLHPADTTANTRWYFLCRGSLITANGEIRITNSYAASTTTLAVTVGAGFGSFAWFSIDEPDFPCEDLAEADGLRPAGTWNGYTLELRSTGVGTFYVASACCFEVPP
ncbi:MAG: hypothetical protein WC211_00895 [Dehalococcoidia bacterium]